MDKQDAHQNGNAGAGGSLIVGLFAALGFCLAAIVFLARTKDPPPIVVPKPKAMLVKMETSMGDIVLELDPENAPKTVANFLGYVDSGHYAGTIFHRVVKPGGDSQMAVIQGGGFDERLLEKPVKAPIALETSPKLLNERGSVAMARTGNPDSATAQFYINISNNDFLNAGPGNPGYAVFGRVVEGMNIVEAIGKVETGPKTGPHGVLDDVPVKTVTINKVSRQ